MQCDICLQQVHKLRWRWQWEMGVWRCDDCEKNRAVRVQDSIIMHVDFSDIQNGVRKYIDSMIAQMLIPKDCVKMTSSPNAYPDQLYGKPVTLPIQDLWKRQHEAEYLMYRYWLTR